MINPDLVAEVWVPDTNNGEDRGAWIRMSSGVKYKLPATITTITAAKSYLEGK